MIRTLKIPFRTTQKDLDRLFACNRTSAQVWNDCLTFAKEHHLRTGNWIDSHELQQLTRRKYNLHSQSIQSIQERYLTARTNAWKAKQQGYSQIRYPYKEKKNYPTRWKKDGFGWRFLSIIHIFSSICPSGLIKIDESYTSQTCHVCARKKKVSGRIFRCHCGYLEHRDIHGAKNILAKYKYGTIINLGIKSQKVTYLRPAV